AGRGWSAGQPALSIGAASRHPDGCALRGTSPPAASGGRTRRGSAAAPRSDPCRAALGWPPLCVVALGAKPMLRFLAVWVSRHWSQRNGAAMAAATVERVQTPSGETLHIRGDRLDLLWEADGQLVLVDPSGSGSRVAGGMLLELAPTAQRRVDETGTVRC